MSHRLKTWPAAYSAIASGQKRHEVRKADRPYAEGDGVLLLEYDPAHQSYTGRSIAFTVGHVTAPGEWGLPPDVCVFTLLPPADAPAGERG
jgi:hypothetical protein